MRLPFAVKAKKSFVAVGTEETGKLYFQKINGRTAQERTVLDAADLSQSKAQLLLLKLAKRIASDKNISPDEALAMVVMADTEDPILAEYLDEVEKLLELKTQAEDFKDLVATTLIQNRMAYPVTIANTTCETSEEIKVESLSFPVFEQDKIAFKSEKIVVSNLAEMDSEHIEIKPNRFPLKAGEVGFLIDLETSEEKLGWQAWELEDTKTLPESLIEMIFEFYQTELSGGKEDTQKKSQSKNPSKPLKNSSKPDASTGNPLEENAVPTSDAAAS